MSATAAGDGAAGRGAVEAARSAHSGRLRGTVRDAADGLDRGVEIDRGARAPAGGVVASVRERIAGIGPIPAVPALMWLLPAIALQATLAAAWPASPAAFELSVFQAVASLAAIVGGGWLIRAAAVELDWNATPVCVDEAPRALVATGPYRLGRHPMYLGAALVLAGTAFALGSVAAAMVAAAYLAWLDLRHARREEAAMHARFGAAWRAYAAGTRRWL